MTIKNTFVLFLTLGLLCFLSAELAAKSKGKHGKHSKGDKTADSATTNSSSPASASGKSSTRKRSFIVYEHIHNRGRPADLTRFGLVPIELCYNTKTKNDVQKSVKSKAAAGKGAPIVFDIEKTNRNDHNLSTGHLKDVTKWAHEAVKGVKVGLYAVGPSHLTPLNKHVEKYVDAFFPSMYVHNSNRTAWEHTAKKLVEQGHRAHKPVYLFLMPKYHGRKGKDIDEKFWEFQLKAAYKSGADGIVIWSSKKSKWDEKAGWWQATKHFLTAIKADKPAAGNKAKK